jgi:3-oxoacyl-[acyl-carrier-protein] synthase II
MRGVSGVQRIGAEIAAHLSSTVAAPACFDAARCFSAARLRGLDRVSQFALAAADQALAESGLLLEQEDRGRIGVYLGSGMGGAETLDAGYATLYRDGSQRIKPYTVLMFMPNAAGAWIALEHGLTGPSLTYSTACSSSAVAVGEAYRAIGRGEVVCALAGGTEAPLTYGTLKAWDAMRTLAIEDPRDPAVSCKPFAKDRTGLVIGEGAAVLVLEELEHARERGAPIRAELVGYGLTTDAAHITRPSVQGQARAMRLALDDAGLAPEAVDYINAHGTGTLQNDAVETAAIKEVFGPRAYRLPVSSTKSMHGHLLGAAGALELIASVLAIEHQAVPPTAHLEVPDPACDLDYVPRLGRSGVQLTTVMSNAFAFGGTNAVLIARSYRSLAS